MKKYTLTLTLLFILTIFISCQPQNTQEQETITPEQVVNPQERIIIASNGAIPLLECNSRNLDSEVIMILSPYCSHCTNTLPVFEETCSAVNITPRIIDISNTTERAYLDSLGIQVQYTPTFIINCKYYIGEYTKESYSTMLNGAS